VRAGELDDILKKAAQAQPDPDPALLDRIAAAIRPNMRPVRPLPPAWRLNIALTAACLAIATIVAARLGLHGLAAMSGLQLLVLAIAPILVGLAAAAWTAEMIPGSRRRESPFTLLAIACASLLALFAALFRDPLTDGFVHPGIACLTAGLVTAVPVALAGWWLLRRGFAVNPTGAAIAAGTFAGLAGVAMLELHCPNFQTWHVLVWHTAVVPVSAALAVLLTKLVQIRRAHVDAR
jgi:hypothetical protein